ncbi:hypothetical protein E1A91_A07G025200v1 [Gossypium mustelinum]|uniref:Uncharacterized protein n=1 Tax=Gossypium mustelinum TaxID=34275 RepID=A0A5D2YF77_GOSMU|nr:hypothetical protein E1A91_A07G025200v1 [Gossypium mustelinum]
MDPYPRFLLFSVGSNTGGAAFYVFPEFNSVWLSGIPCDGCIPLQPYAENREHFYSLSSPPNGHSLFGKSFISPILPSPISHLPSFLSSLNSNQ